MELSWDQIFYGTNPNAIFFAKTVRIRGLSRCRIQPIPSDLETTGLGSVLIVGSQSDHDGWRKNRDINAPEIWIDPRFGLAQWRITTEGSPLVALINPVI